MNTPLEQKERIEIGQRIRIERKRVGLTLPAFGQIGGVQKNAQLAYEAGERMPDAEYLRRVWRYGSVDAQFIVTGFRENKVVELSDADRKVLDQLSVLPPRFRASIDDVLLLASLACGDRKNYPTDWDPDAPPAITSAESPSKKAAPKKKAA